MLTVTSNCLVITGFHRSGTSITAKVLHGAGLYLGDRLMGANIDNPDGHYEDWDIVELHNKILRENSTSWQYDETSKLSVSSEALESMRTIAHKRQALNTLWGFKDPRVCLFLDAWQTTIPNLKVLIVYRHYSYCLHSLFKRHAQINMLNSKPFSPYNSDHKLWLDLELGLRMWLAYNKALLNYAKINQDSVLVVPHQAIKQGYDVIAAVNQAFGFKLEENNIKVFNKQYTEDSPAYLDQSKISQNLIQDLDNTWHKLCELSTQTPEAPRPVFLKPPDISQNELLSKYFPNYKVENLETVGQEGRNQINVGAEESAKLLLADVKAQLQQGNFEKVVAIVKMGLSKYPLEPLFYTFLGRAMMQLQNFEVAIVAFSQAITINPNPPYFYINLAEAYFRNSQYKEAEFFAKKALAKNPKNINFYCLLIRLSLKQKQWERIEEFIQKAQEIDDQNQQLLSLKAAYYEELGELEKAVNVAEEGCKLYPKNAALHQVLYRIYTKQGRKNEAEEKHNSYTNNIINAKNYPQKLVAMLDSVEGEAARNGLILYLSLGRVDI